MEQGKLPTPEASLVDSAAAGEQVGGRGRLGQLSPLDHLGTGGVIATPSERQTESWLSLLKGRIICI